VARHAHDLLLAFRAAREANSQAVTGGGAAASPIANLHPHDPEHLIVNGLGGAFLHPTHVFAPARFASVPDPPADDLFEAGMSPRLGRGRSPKGVSPAGGSPRGTSPAGRSPTRKALSRRGSFTGASSPPSSHLCVWHVAETGFFCSCVVGCRSRWWHVPVTESICRCLSLCCWHWVAYMHGCC
jgi:hypothetical protein